MDLGIVIVGTIIGNLILGGTATGLRYLLAKRMRSRLDAQLAEMEEWVAAQQEAAASGDPDS